jgi:hypothetical protein
MSVRSTLEALAIPALGGVGLLLVLAQLATGQQAPIDDLTARQINMLAAEVQFFNALARQQKDELDKIKAATPCSEPK